jgi:hypothetical protein
MPKQGGEARRRWLHYDVNLSEDARAVAEAERAIQQQKAANEALPTAAESAATARSSTKGPAAAAAVAVASGRPSLPLALKGARNSSLQAPGDASLASPGARRPACVPRLDLTSTSGSANTCFLQAINPGTGLQQQQQQQQHVRSNSVLGKEAVASLAASLPATLRGALPSGGCAEPGTAAWPRSARASGVRGTLIRVQPCHDEWQTAAASTLARRHSCSLMGGTPRAQGSAASATVRAGGAVPKQQQQHHQQQHHHQQHLLQNLVSAARASGGLSVAASPRDVAPSVTALMQQGGRGSVRGFCSTELRSARPSLPSQLLAHEYRGPVEAALAVRHMPRSSTQHHVQALSPATAPGAQRGWCSARNSVAAHTTVQRKHVNSGKPLQMHEPPQLVLTNVGCALVSGDGRLIDTLPASLCDAAITARLLRGSMAGGDAATAGSLSPAHQSSSGIMCSPPDYSSSSGSGGSSQAAAITSRRALAQQLVRPHSIFRTTSSSGSGSTPRCVPSQRITAASFFLDPGTHEVHSNPRSSGCTNNSVARMLIEAGACKPARRNAGCGPLGGHHPAYAGGSYSPRLGSTSAVGGASATGAVVGGPSSSGSSQIGLLLAAAASALRQSAPPLDSGHRQLRPALQSQAQACQLALASPRLSYSGLSPRRVRL